MKHYGDITKINGAELPIVDIICGGSPCQDLSVAGGRKGLSGERSGLFMDQLRLIREQRNECIRQLSMRGADEPVRPRYMVWENVPGALSSGKPKGEDFRIVLEETARIADEAATIPEPPKGKWSNAGVILGNGWSLAWRVHDAQYFGVAQRRRRLCLLADFDGDTAGRLLFELQRKALTGDNLKTFGDIRDQSRPQISTVGESLSGDTEQGEESWEGTPEDARGCTDKAVSFQERAGKPGGGKGLLIQREKTGALATHPQSVCAISGETAGTLDASYYKGCGERNGVEREVVALGLDRASFNQGKNAKYDFSIEEEKAPTLVSKGPGGVLAKQ